MFNLIAACYSVFESKERATWSDSPACGIYLGILWSLTTSAVESNMLLAERLCRYEHTMPKLYNVVMVSFYKVSC